MNCRWEAGSSPDHGLTAAKLIDQERQHRGLLRRTVGSERLRPQAKSQGGHLCLIRVTLHVDLQNLRHIVPVDLHISQVVPQDGFTLKKRKKEIRKFKRDFLFMLCSLKQSPHCRCVAENSPSKQLSPPDAKCLSVPQDVSHLGCADY